MRSAASAREKETLMSARSNTDRSTATDRRNLEQVAWRVFREAGLGYTETRVGEGVHEKVLAWLGEIGYDALTLVRLSEACEYDAVDQQHYQSWIDQSTPFTAQAYLTTYALVHRLSQMLKYPPRFGRFDGLTFVGRYRRNTKELRLTMGQRLVKDLPWVNEVDLWVSFGDSVDDIEVIVSGDEMKPVRWTYTDYYNGRLDSHATEAFRRLELEREYDWARRRRAHRT
jgi:hypothetical protein